MVGILDNKKTSELVVKLSDTEYEKINPETLAQVVIDESKEDANVQEHINDKNIHFSKTEFDELNKKNLTPEKVIAGNNITVTRDEVNNTVTITASDHPTEGFLKKTDIQAADDSITVIPEDDSNVVKIKANIPATPEGVLKQENIKAGANVSVEYDEDTNDVYISSEGRRYIAGDGINIKEDLLIENTKPDVEVNLTAGDNVKIEGSYPNFTISASSGAMIDDWMPNTDYFKGQFLVYQNSIYRCNENHTSGEQFEPTYWELIAGYKISRSFYLDNLRETTAIVLPKKVPSKEVLTINVGGLVLQSQNYNLEPDQETVTFLLPIPKEEIIEVSIAGNEIFNTFDTGVNISEWKSNQSYAKGNIVIYNNSLFRCLENHISQDIFEDSKWQIVAGYVKDYVNFVSDVEVTEINLPYNVYNKNDLMVNVNGKLLMTSEYSLNDESNKVIFNDAIHIGEKVEITIFNNMVLQNNSIPTPIDKPQQYLRSNIQETGYELITSNEVKDQLGLSSFTNYENNGGKLYVVNSVENDVEMISPNKLAGNVGVRKIAQGFKINVLYGQGQEEYPPYNTREMDELIINPGSIMSDDGTTMIELKEQLIKNPNKQFEEGTNKGSSLLAGSGDVWTQPIMTSADKPYGQAIATSELTDREAWRAMDIYPSEGNGWLANESSADWFYIANMPIYVYAIEFIGQESVLNNRPKDIDVYVGKNTNIKASFTAPNENIVQQYVSIQNPEWSPVIGLRFKNSYGNAIGMKHIIIHALYPAYVAKNNQYFIYVISNTDGSKVDVLTTMDKQPILPEGFTKIAKIGSFSSDDNWKIYDVYPDKDLPTMYKDGIHGYFNGYDKLETWVSNSDGFASKVMEQWGYAKPDSNRFIEFPHSYKKECFYVNANGYRVTNITAEGFTVSTSNYIYWNAKGI